jgi:hypothetical protein
MKQLKLVLFILFTLLLNACTWVELTPEGEKARILSMEEVSGCKKMGQTTSTTKATMAGVARHPNAINDELNTLARNSAINLKADTIVPVGEILDGKRTYMVYRCVPE